MARVNRNAVPNGFPLPQRFSCESLDCLDEREHRGHIGLDRGQKVKILAVPARFPDPSVIKSRSLTPVLGSGNVRRVPSKSSGESGTVSELRLRSLRTIDYIGSLVSSAQILSFSSLRLILIDLGAWPGWTYHKVPDINCCSGSSRGQHRGPPILPRRDN
jgi:hypothetical protein